MVAKTFSVCAFGIDGISIEIQIDCKIGLPTFNIIGQASRSTQESRERIISAIRNSGYEYKPQRVTVNLLPSNVLKDGPHFDLAIAMAYLQATKQIQPEENVCYIGELGLDGGLLPVNSINILLNAIKNKGYSRIYIPAANEKDIAFDYALPIIGVSVLKDVVNQNGSLLKLGKPADKVDVETFEQTFIWDQITDNKEAKDSMLVALCGGHHILLFGSPGSGKTMLANAALDLLPNLSIEDAQVVSLVYERSNKPRKNLLTMPVRQPHHSSTLVGLLGGGANLIPGEISLAHKGILYLDELSEFDTKVLESLRIPLSEGQVTLAKGGNVTTLPADFQLVATTNPCACGMRGNPDKLCICTEKSKQTYWKNLSTAIFDRFDLIIPMFHVKHGNATQLCGLQAKSLVGQIRELQIQRQGKLNSKLYLSEMQSYKWFSAAWDWVNFAFNQSEISMRRKLSIVKMARTIADINNREFISTIDLSQAVRYSAGGKWS